MAVPPRLYEELSLPAQTAYAELIESARARELDRSIAHLSGSFSSKTVKGRTYWYYQYRDVDGSVRQIYVGPDTGEIRALMARAREKPTRALEPLARSAIALGCERVLPRHFRIVRRLSEYGFFHAGGVLIGTHAFLSIGNLLGVPTFGGEAGATYLNPREPELRLDFLTTLHRRGGRAFTPENLNVALQPLKFMEFALEHPVQAAVFCEEGAVTVNIPSPARYALHKLLVWGERKEAFRTKAAKDLLQAAALIAYFKDHRSEELRDAWRDLLSRGKGWRTRARQGRNALSKAAPDLQLDQLLPNPAGKAK